MKDEKSSIADHFDWNDDDEVIQLQNNKRKSVGWREAYVPQTVDGAIEIT
jgi:hypothetical protein